MKRTISILLLLALPFGYANAGDGVGKQNKIKLKKERHYHGLLAEIGYYQNFTNAETSGFNIGLGYEYSIPSLENLAFEAKISYYAIFDETAKYSTNSGKVTVSEFTHFQSNAVNISIAPKIYIGIADKVSLFVSNEFGFIKSFATLTTKSYPKTKDTSPFRFHYSFKIGTRFIPFSDCDFGRYSLWVGIMTLNLDRQKRAMLPKEVQTRGLKLEWCAGFSVHF